MNGTILSDANNVLVFGFPFVICEGVLVSDGTDIGVMGGFDSGADKVGLVLFRVDGKGTEKFLGLI